MEAGSHTQNKEKCEVIVTYMFHCYSSLVSSWWLVNKWFCWQLSTFFCLAEYGWVCEGSIAYISHAIALMAFYVTLHIRGAHEDCCCWFKLFVYVNLKPTFSNEGSILITFIYSSSVLFTFSIARQTDISVLFLFHWYCCILSLIMSTRYEKVSVVT